MVSGVESHSPAGIAGLERGDLVLSVDGNPVRDMGHLMRMIGDLVAGSTANLMIHRDDEAMEIDVVLGSRPETLDLE
jgi:serine protease Do